MPSTSMVLPEALAPEAVISSMMKKRGPFISTMSAPKRCFMASSVMPAQIFAGQSLWPSVL
jgi:hypothetical protein